MKQAISMLEVPEDTSSRKHILDIGVFVVVDAKADVASSLGQIGDQASLSDRSFSLMKIVKCFSYY